AGADRSILIGDTGADNLVGGTYDDILIAGTTSYDTNLPALNVLLKEWVRTDLSYNNRVNDIMVGGKGSLNVLNGTPILLYKGSSSTGTVVDNTVANTINGGSPGLDLIFYDVKLTTLTNKL